MIENYNEQNNKIINILKTSLTIYENKIHISDYEPKIIKSGINIFNKEKKYLDTSCVEGINNINNNGEIITYNKRPSRANMQPVENSIWFAKMKDSNKILIITNKDDDILKNNILSTGYLGIEESLKMPLSLLTAIIISDNFHVQRDLNSVGTTMAGINNETFLKILVPKLEDKEIREFDNKYRSLVYLLSLNRKKINNLNIIKNKLLNKYF